jgi:hypothetical protein
MQVRFNKNASAQFFFLLFFNNSLSVNIFLPSSIFFSSNKIESILPGRSACFNTSVQNLNFPFEKAKKLF